MQLIDARNRRHCTPLYSRSADLLTSVILQLSMLLYFRMYMYICICLFNCSDAVSTQVDRKTNSHNRTGIRQDGNAQPRPVLTDVQERRT